MEKVLRRFGCALLIAAGLAQTCLAQQALTWAQIRDKFESANPSLRAAQIGVDESRANEITACLRPNPNISGTLDQINPFTSQPSLSGSGDSYRPFAYALPSGSIDYSHERQRKRELRLESAKHETEITASQRTDLERNLLFNLRGAFIQTLQSNAVLDLAKDNLVYYDHVLDVNRERYRLGSIAQVDLDHLELQRIQYKTDLQTAAVNLRTAKIQLLALLNDRTPVEQFDVTGNFDFSAEVQTLEVVRQTAVDTRPDLRAALQSIQKAKTDHKLAVANGSTDPTFSLDFSRNPPIPVYLGVSVSIPLRIFDRNQGVKLQTELDIDRNEKSMEATKAQVFNDVDSAHATLKSTITLLQADKDRYLARAVRVRETIAFSYQRGGASLLDFLNAQADYRSVQLNYLNLVGSYLGPANQLNLAVGREVIQ